MNRRTNVDDSGSILPLVLVVSVVLALVVVAIASYATSALKLGHTVEESGDRVAAAEGGLDWALDRYTKGLTTCASGSGVETTEFQGDVNGLNAEVTCRLVGAALPAGSGFAAVMTGEYLTATDPLLQRGGANSESKDIRGPIYMERPNISLTAPVDVVNGHLLYQQDPPACDGHYIESNPTLDSDFTLRPPGLSYCTNQTWHDLFEPNAPVIALPVAAAPSPIVDPNGCKIWFPGVYDGPASAPDFSGATPGQQTYNYFVSGDYYFDDVGEIDLKGAYVLAGYPGIRGPNLVKVKPGDTFDNNVCRHAWWYDGYFNPDEPADGVFGDRQGATWYLGGSSSIFINSNSALEIDGRPQGFLGTDKQARVSFQTINPGGSDGTDLTGMGEILTTKAGSGSQLAMRGLVWTPHSRFNFSNVANDVVAALQGGAVVSNLEIGAAAQTDGFAIEIASQPLETQFEVESTATNSGTVTVRAVLDYQPSPSDVTVISRRIMEITPES
jgi:hypothetical protein